jgi:putative component of toxin-antitoxin plasmid stabilization module
VPGEWTPEPFEADDGTIPFERFINGLSDFQFVALDTAIDRVLSVRGIELVRTEWLKALGDGLHEFRVRHDASEIAHMFGGDTPTVAVPSGHVLLRVFVHFHGDKVVLLLGGYDKGADPKDRRQQREIAQARRLLAQFRARRRREQASRRRRAHG